MRRVSATPLEVGRIREHTDLAKLFAPDGGEHVRTLGVSLRASVLVALVIVAARGGRDHGSKARADGA